MFHTIWRRQAVWLARISWLLLFSMFSACKGATSQATSQPQVVAPTIIVTQVVEYVVATLPPSTSTPVPSPTSAPVHSTTWDPFSAPVYYPVVGCVASRLHIGDVAFVAQVDRPAFLYYYKEIAGDPGVRQLQTGEHLEITKGPWCSDGSLVWQVRAGDKHQYFAVEGDGEIYWLLPLAPFVPSPTPKTK
jgi:hypothetical protein